MCDMSCVTRSLFWIALWGGVFCLRYWLLWWSVCVVSSVWLYWFSVSACASAFILITASFLSVFHWFKWCAFIFPIEGATSICFLFGTWLATFPIVVMRFSVLIHVRLSVTVLVSYLSSTSIYLSNSYEMENLSITPVHRKREGHTFEKYRSHSWFVSEVRAQCVPIDGRAIYFISSIFIHGVNRCKNNRNAHIHRLFRAWSTIK